MRAKKGKITLFCYDCGVQPSQACRPAPPLINKYHPGRRRQPSFLKKTLKGPRKEIREDWMPKRGLPRKRSRM